MLEPASLDRSAELDPAILLVDMDSFFASVEILDRPELRDKPVLVGGSGRRGVVASCSYEARRFGIRSAMPMVTALRLCPNAVVLPGNMPRYAALSAELRRIFLDVTPLVEPLAFDEAFLDVSGAVGLLGSPRSIAAGIRERIAEELSLNCAVGVASTKLIAKLASRQAKPTISDGIVKEGTGVAVILDEEVPSFLNPLSVGALFGVGPATQATLHRLGIETVADLATLEPSMLARHLGASSAQTLVALARGEDPRPVVPDQGSKSLGHEETFATDSSDISFLEGRLRRQAIAVAGALRAEGLKARTLTVKMRDGERRTRTRSATLDVGLDDPTALAEVALGLLGTLDLSPGVRLLGLSASSLEDRDTPVQLRLGVAGEEGPAADRAVERQQTRAALEDVVAEVRARFGRHSVGPLTSLGPDGVAVPAQRDVPFGPEAEAKRVEG